MELIVSQDLWSPNKIQAFTLKTNYTAGQMNIKISDFTQRMKCMQKMPTFNLYSSAKLAD